MANFRTPSVLEHLNHLLASAGAAADDGRLLERFVECRDQDAFAALVKRHGPLVFGLCRRLLGNVQDAEDVFQATFLVLARKAAVIRKPESLSCWLHGVAYRLALKARVQANSRRIRELQDAVTAKSAEDDLSWREVRGLLDEELQRLPEKQRLPLVLCYLEGLTQDEASRHLGWPRGTLKRRLEAGRERLRNRLTRRGVTLGAGLFAVALTESATTGAVPIPLRSATVRASVQFVTHETAELAATPVALLAKGALGTMLTTKLRIGAMLILLFGFAAAAAGLAIPQAPVENQPESKAEAPPQARPAKDEHVRKDRYGDPLPQGAIARIGTVRLRHQGPIGGAVFTPDSKTVIVGDTFGDIISWDVASGRKVRQWPHVQSGYSLALSADGKTLVSPGWGGDVYLWNVDTGKQYSQLPVKIKSGVYTELLLTSDSKYLLIGERSSKTIQVWDIAGKKMRHELKGYRGIPGTLALGPDGKLLAMDSEADKHIHLCDVATGEEKLRFAGSQGGLRSVAFSPDGKTLVATGQRLFFWDTATGKKIREQPTVSSPLTFVYSPDGKVLAGRENDFQLHFYDAKSGKHLRAFDQALNTLNGPSYSPDGKTIATYWNSTQALNLLDAASGKPLHSDRGHRSAISALVFSADEKSLYSAARFGFAEPLSVWDANTGEPRGQLGDNQLGTVAGLALSPDGKLLAACGYKDHAIRLWDTASLKEARTLKGHTVGVDSVVWSADGKTLASRCNLETTIRLWNAVSGQPRGIIEAKLQPDDWDIALSPDGKIVASCGNRAGTIRLYSVEAGKELRSIKTSQGNVFALAFSPDGSILASGGLAGGIRLWDAATGQLRQQWDDKQSWIGRLVFSRDGRTLISGHGDLTGTNAHAVRLWEVATGRERACFLGHRGAVRRVAITRDGRHVASGSNDTTILVWDATGGARADGTLTTEKLRTLWNDLSDADAGRAYRAMWQMALSPKQALPFLAERVHPVAPLDSARQKQVEGLLADLDSDQFAVRQPAEMELEKMGPMVEPALRKALKGKPSLEVRRRIETLSAKWSDERLRIARALEAIEHMNTPEARRLLASLAKGAAQAWLTEAACAIRKRLEKQAVTVPEQRREPFQSDPTGPSADPANR